MIKFMNRIVKNEILLAAICIAIFTGLTLASIAKFSVWHDESYTATLIESSFSGVIERTGNDVHPPLYYLLLKSWSLIFGDSILALRLFSSVTILIAVIITWRIIRKSYGTKIGLLALLMMSIGPFLVRYGQEMRMYGLAALLASMATYLYIRSCNKESPVWVFVSYGVVLALGFYTQYFFILVPITHLAHFLIYSKNLKKTLFQNLKPYLTSFLTAGILVLPWIPTIFKQYKEVQGAFWIGPVGVETITSTPIAMTIFEKQFEMTGLLGLLSVIALVSVVLFIKQFHSIKKDDVSKLFFLSVVLPPAALFLLSLPPLQPSYQDRYMSFFAPIFYSVLGIGALSAKNKKLKLFGVAVVVSLLFIGQVNHYKNGNNHGWNPKPYFTMNQIAQQINDGSPVFSTSLWTFFDAHITMKDKGYEGDVKLLLKELPDSKMGNWSAVYGRADLFATSIPENLNTFWLIDEPSLKYEGRALDKFLPKEKKDFGYATLTRYIKASN